MKFEKVSRAEFEKSCRYADERMMYDNIQLPRRSTKGSAGYDIFAPIGIEIEPNETVVIPTGLKVQIDEGYVMLIFIRSSYGITKGLELPTGVAVIDSDYYNNPDNEGHFFLAFRNTTKRHISLNPNQRIAQGVFVKYGITDDDNAEGFRNGGIGSTGND